MNNKFFIFFLACFITGCGQSGGLYLPVQSQTTDTPHHHPANEHKAHETP